MFDEFELLQMLDFDFSGNLSCKICLVIVSIGHSRAFYVVFAPLECVPNIP